MTGKINVTVKRSRRRTIAVQITSDCVVVVRAPYSMTDEEIQSFVDSRKSWIGRHLMKMEAQQAERSAYLKSIGADQPFSDQEIREMTREAKELLPKLVEHHAKKIGVDYNRVTIRHQRTRWGSCSAKGNLNFNCLLVRCPEEVQNYVVIHELCHRRQMNHSRRFWREVQKYMPDYQRWVEWLHAHGDELVSRLPE